MHANKTFNRDPVNHRLYHALIEALIEDKNAMDKGVADTVQDHKKNARSESSKKPSSTKETQKGKAPSKGSKIGKCATAKEPVEEPIAEVIMDDAGDNVVHDDDQPQDTSEPKTAKTPNPEWFTQPPRPPTPDSEWNKHQIVLDQPKQPWFNKIIHPATNSLSHFSDLMATLVTHILLNNPEGDLTPLNCSKPLPQQGSPRSLIIKKCVEDLQLGVESYQKKLNITPPQQTFLEIEFKELYTSSHKPPWGYL
ncbi:hypothetical protein Tco_0813248 [Tanacetum coccineum]